MNKPRRMDKRDLRELISAERIEERIRDLGKNITNDYAGCPELVVICVLNGAFMFTADLVRHIDLPCRIEFLRASSYGNRQTSSGKVTITHDIDIGKRHVLLVEDIVDTGLTISGIIAELRNLDPLSLRVCTLLDKPSQRRVMVSPDYTGFTIPAYFVVGYGLDIAGKFRELPYIGVYRP